LILAKEVLQVHGAGVYGEAKKDKNFEVMVINNLERLLMAEYRFG